jgi:hypothetical protein
MTTSNPSSRNGPTTLAVRALKAWHDRGIIFVRLGSGHEVSFPIKGNPASGIGRRSRPWPYRDFTIWAALADA